MFKLLSRIWRSYNEHLDRMMVPFQAILKNDDLEKLKTKYYYRWDYFIPFALTASICIDTVIQYLIHGYDLKKRVFFNHIIVKSMPDFFIERGNLNFFLAFFS